jgi:hypothetical protein
MMATMEKALECCVLPNLDFAAQTWSLTDKHKKMMEVCQHKMERKVLGGTMKDNIQNTEVGKRTSTQDTQLHEQRYSSGDGDDM